MSIFEKDKDDELEDDKTVVVEDADDSADDAADDKDDARLSKTEGEASDDELTDEQRREKNRRNRHKRRDRYRRLAAENQQKDEQLKSFQAALAEANTRLAKLEGGVVDNQKAQVERAIAGAGRHLEAATADLKRGMAEQDADLVADANRRIAKITVDQAELQKIRDSFDVQDSKKDDAKGGDAADASQKRDAPQIHPGAVRNGQIFAARHSWFNPKSDDKDSKMVLLIDASVHEDGFRPETKEYWEEIEDRMKDLLPHRMRKSAKNEDADNDDNPEDDDEVEVDAPPSGGSGKKNGLSKNGTAVVKLSSARVAALKEAGMWDDPEQRKRMMKRYQAYDKIHNRRGA